MGIFLNVIAHVNFTIITNYSALQMKIYTLTLELYTEDQTDPNKWNWDDMIPRLGIKNLDGMLISCERRYDLESTIPSQEETSDTNPPNSDS